MPLSRGRHFFVQEDVGDVTVVRFMVRSLRDEQEILAAFEQLRELVEGQGRQKLVLDFGPVQAIASYAIAKLLALDKQLQPPQGRLALCNLSPLFTDILQVMRLDRHLHLYATEQEALQSF